MEPVLTREEAIDAAVRRHFADAVMIEDHEGPRPDDEMACPTCWFTLCAIRAEFRRIVAA